MAGFVVGAFGTAGTGISLWWACRERRERLRADRRWRQQGNDLYHFLLGLKGAELTPRMDAQVNDRLERLKDWKPADLP